MKNSDNFDIVKLSHDSPIPLYYQIEQKIIENIKNGELKPGDQILTEEKMQKKFNVSRATVRKAIEKLVYEGILEKRPPKGTVVAKPKIEEAMYGVHSFTNSILKTNKTLTSKIIEFKKIQGNKMINEKLDVLNSSSLIFIKRIRMIEDTPICIEDWYAPYEYFPDLNTNMFSDKGYEQSTYYILNKYYNIKMKKIHDVMSAVTLNKDDASLLGLAVNSPVLLRQRISYDENDRKVVYSSGKYIIKIALDFYSNNDNE